MEIKVSLRINRIINSPNLIKRSNYVKDAAGLSANVSSWQLKKISVPFLCQTATKNSPPVR